MFRNIDTRMGHLYLDKIFFSFYGDIGNAWYGDIPKLNTFKKGAGAEIRFRLIHFIFSQQTYFSMHHMDLINLKTSK